MRAPWVSPASGARAFERSSGIRRAGADRIGRIDIAGRVPGCGRIAIPRTLPPVPLHVVRIGRIAASPASLPATRTQPRRSSPASSGGCTGSPGRSRGDDVLAEDVAQEALLRAWRHASAYDPRRGSVATWLLTITRNLAIDQVRVRRPIAVDPAVLAGRHGSRERTPARPRPPRSWTRSGDSGSRS